MNYFFRYSVCHWRTYLKLHNVLIPTFNQLDLGGLKTYWGEGGREANFEKVWKGCMSCIWQFWSSCLVSVQYLDQPSNKNSFVSTLVISCLFLCVCFQSVENSIFINFDYCWRKFLKYNGLIHITKLLYI